MDKNEIMENISQILPMTKMNQNIQPLCLKIQRQMASYPIQNGLLEKMDLMFLFEKAGILSNTDIIRPIMYRVFKNTMDDVVMEMRKNPSLLEMVDERLDFFIEQMDLLDESFKYEVVDQLSRITHLMEMDFAEETLNENTVSQMTPIASLNPEDEESPIEKFLENAVKLGIDIDNPLNEALHIGRRVKSGYGKIYRAKRNVERGIDSVGDAVLDGNKKYKILEVRKDILRGRKSFSHLSKIALMMIAAGASLSNAVLGFPAIAIYLIRNRRITRRERQKFKMELENEIQIIDEKIKDAEADGDRKKKYQLMRLKNDMEKTIQHLKFHSKLNISDNRVGHKL